MLLLGAAAAAAVRLPLQLLPVWTFPELGVSLSLPEEQEVDELTRRFLLPLETAIRAIGEVRETGGDVSSTGAFLRVRLEPGADAERKAARLESESAALRRRLPAGSRLDIWPAGRGGGDSAAAIWLRQDPAAPDQRVDRALLDALRALPEVRGVSVAGDSTPELRVTARHHVPEETLAAAIDAELTTRRLGTQRTAGRAWPVVAEPPTRTLEEIPVRRGDAVVALASVADFRLARDETPLIAHIRGRSGKILILDREHDASPFALHRAVLDTLARFGLEDSAEILIDEAQVLRVLVLRLLGGLAAAALAMGLVGTLLGGLRLGAALACAPPRAVAAKASRSSTRRLSSRSARWSARRWSSANPAASSCRSPCGCATPIGSTNCAATSTTNCAKSPCRKASISSTRSLIPRPGPPSDCACWRSPPPFPSSSWPWRSAV